MMRIFPIALAIAVASPGFAQSVPVSLDPPFSAGAVLQRGQPIRIRGHATPKAKVQVTLAGQTVVAKAAADGSWLATFAPMVAAKDLKIVASSNGVSTEADGIAVGDVFLCSGQSNMEMALSRTALTPEQFSRPIDAALHLMTVEREEARLPQATFAKVPIWKRASDPAGDAPVGGAWLPGSTTAGNFSAVCFLAGREIAQRQKVEVGLIDASWGGTPIEAWMSPGAIAEAGGMEEGVAIHRAFLADPVAAEAKYGKMLAEYWVQNRRDGPRIGYANLYNAMIAPLRDFGLAGALWYQGENNAGQGNSVATYRARLEAMMRAWRGQLRSDLPFVIVQIAGFGPLAKEPGDANSARIREAQRQAVAADPHAALVVTTDVSERLDIHPPLKLPVAQRAVLGLRRLVYGEPVSSGPEFADARLSEGAVTITIAGASGSLVAASWGRPGPFMVCSAGSCRYADAEFTGNGIRVLVGEGPVPDTVRYCYAAAPICNVFDGAGLPLGPFSASLK